jgi:ribosomal protein L37AE/L43A
MDKVKEYFRKIYGMDALSCGCILMSVIINLIAMLCALAGHAWSDKWTILVYIPLAICLFRCLSTRRNRRAAENDWFIQGLESMFTKKPKPVYGQNYRMESEIDDRRSHKFFKCPACRQKIRVPRGKGRIEITCPRCGDRFIKKT